MAKALRIGIPLTTIGWVALGIIVTFKEWDQALELTGIGGVIMAWSFCLLLVLGLLLSPWAEKASPGKRVTVLFMMVPGLVFHVALIVEAFEEWIWLNLFLALSCLVWYGSAFRLLRAQMKSKQRC